ncbi:MAG: alpha/beta hydrolase [Burkholderiaceae bacterium]|nr:alpha/beta hydrolase [Burkholderiaceae bacterium]
MKLRRKRFELMVVEPNRHRLLVGEDIGDEQASDLFLCLPGLLETRQAFDEFVRYVGPSARVMTFDWCGRGDSQKLENAHDYKMSVYLSDLSLFYAHAMGAISSNARDTASRIHLVGTSMGGLLAVFLAIHRPRNLGTVILNDVGPVLPWSGVFSLMTGISSAKSADLKNITEFNTPNLAEKLRVDPQLLRAVRQPGHLDLPHETRLTGVDFSDAFAAVTAPILLLRGAGSEIINDSVVKRIFELHPLTRIHECQDSGHPVAYSEEVCAAILKFVSQH